MIWVVLWVGALIAFLYYFLGRRWLYVLLFPVGLIALVALFIGAYVLQEALLRRGFGGALETVSKIGWVVLIGAVTGLVGSLAAIVAYAIRDGASDDEEGTVVIEDRPMTMSLGNPRQIGRSKRKVLVSKGGLVSMQSLVDGTATAGERLLALGIGGALTSFLFVFVGGALIVAKTSLVFLLFVSVPALWFRKIAREAWRDYRKARKKVAA